MSCDPGSREVLVTDGHSAVGQSLVRALVTAGARRVWVGDRSPGNRTAELDALVLLGSVMLLPLDLRSSESVAEAGAQLGARIDIIINNAEYHRAHGVASSRGVGSPQAEMEVNYFGLLRLAQEFGPAMRARAGEERGATAWVNLLSVYALSNYPSHGTFSASKAAALSLSQCLRAQMQSFGIRVINVFPGPIDDEWNRLVPPPKIGADALAREIIKALQLGQEDVYPGDAAQEWLARWRANPKVLERELAT
jgi:NAD(P)-dependent dehydrogenase (short-subunit alcohol dehydrogenase family)